MRLLAVFAFVAKSSAIGFSRFCILLSVQAVVAILFRLGSLCFCSSVNGHPKQSSINVSPRAIRERCRYPAWLAGLSLRSLPLGEIAQHKNGNGRGPREVLSSERWNIISSLDQNSRSQDVESS